MVDPLRGHTVRPSPERRIRELEIALRKARASNKTYYRRIKKLAALHGTDHHGRPVSHVAKRTALVLASGIMSLTVSSGIRVYKNDLEDVLLSAEIKGMASLRAKIGLQPGELQDEMNEIADVLAGGRGKLITS